MQPSVDHARPSIRPELYQRDATNASLLDSLRPAGAASRQPLVTTPPTASLLPRPTPLSLGPRSSHPELSLAVAPASFSSASDILSFGSSSDEEDDDGEGLRIDDIEEEQESSTEDEDVPWRPPSARSRGSNESDGRMLPTSAEDDSRHRPPLRGRRSRDLSSESTAALLVRQQQQHSSFESRCWLGGGGREGGLKPSPRPSSSPGQLTTVAGRLAPPSPSTSASSSPERSRRRSRSRSRSYPRPGSPILESATSASDDSPPRAGEPDSASSSPRASSPVATPTPPGRSVRFNPRMKTRTAYGSYQSDRSVELVSASPAASFLAWRYPRNARAISAKRAPAVASWKAYYGSLDNGGSGAPSSVPHSSNSTPSASASRAKDDVPPTAAADFGSSVWERLCRPGYWRWKAGLDDWAEGGCCALPNWAADDEDGWGATNAAAGAGGLSVDRRRPGGGLGGGFGESRPGGMF